MRPQTTILVIVLLGWIVLIVRDAHLQSKIERMRSNFAATELAYQDLVARAYRGERIVFAKDMASLQGAVDSLTATGGTIMLTGTRYMAYPSGFERYRGKVWIVAMRQDDFVPKLWAPTADGLARACEYVDLDSAPGAK